MPPLCPMQSATCYLNGEFLPLAAAKVSVLDRGFIFGDGVYEVIPVYGRKAFRLNHHLQRLQNSLDAIRIDNPLSNQEWQQIIDTLIEQNEGDEQSIYLHVTRGVAQRDHAFPAYTPATVFLMSNPLLAPEPTTVALGIKAVTLPDIRWLNCHIKAISLLPNILFRQQAIDSGSDEAILIRDGMATEGAASNLFIVKDGVIITPPKGSQLLPGITRDLIVELAQQHQLNCEEREITEQQLFDADEIWISSSTKEVVPVLELNQQTVGGGQPGPVWKQIYLLYQAMKQELRNGQHK
ncbi:MAG: D-amino acid aminotransferase [Gammaproteobacteria bacterium]|nr:D-amino acid aminotransferase [Gammaproteobacteria bacterium]